MKWQGRRRSSNVTDARGKRVAASSAGLATLLNFVGRRFGLKGILMLAALGINVPLIYTGVFILGSALAGIGGALAAPFNSPTPGMDATVIVDCFVIVIIGGLGSLWGSFFGALIYGLVFNFGSVIVPNWQDVFAFLLLMGVLLVRPWGLFGRPDAAGH